MPLAVLSQALRRPRPTLATLVSCCGLAACALPPAGPPASASLAQADPGRAATRQLHALFDAAWEQTLLRYPTWATLLGDRRYGDRLEDASPEAEAAGYAETRRHLAQAQALPRVLLSVTDRTSLDLFIHELDDTLRFEPLLGFRRLSLGAIGGFQTGFSALLQASPTDNRAAAEQLLARLAAYPRRVDQELVRLRQGIRLGWVAPPAVLDRVLATLDGQLAAEGDASPFSCPSTVWAATFRRPSNTS